KYFPQRASASPSAHFPRERGKTLRLWRLARLVLGGGAHRALGDAGRLTAAVAQVVELGPPHHAAALDLDALDHRRGDREDPLDALAEADLAHGEVLMDAGAVAGD